MKVVRGLSVLLIAFTVVACVFPASAAVRTVLMEGFTQWNCGPCASWNPTERVVLQGLTRDTVVAIKYHVSWPSPDNDGFYHWTPETMSESSARWNYYGVSGVPDGYIDGRTPMTRSQTGFRNQIRTRRAVAAPCTIEASASAQGPNAVHFTATITATDSALTSTRAFAVLITDLKTYASSPGSNGERSFPEIFRDMYPNAQGETVSIPLGGNITFEGTLRKDSTWSPDSLSVVIFLQDYASKWVHQAAYAPVMNLWAVNTSSEEPRQRIVNPGDGQQDYVISVQNMGRNDDSYTISLESEWPAGWTHSLEAMGIPSDPTSITVPMTSDELNLVTVHVNPNGNPGHAQFAVNVQSTNNENTSATQAFRLMSRLDVLVVNDSPSDGSEDLNPYYISALNRAQPNKVAGWWNVGQSSLDDLSLTGIPIVIWYTGSSPYGQTLSPAEQSIISSYLDGSGKLFLSGQAIAFDLRTSSFLSEYLHTAHVGPNPSGITMAGVAGDDIGNGLSISISGGDGAGNQGRQSSIRVASDDLYGSTVFAYTGGTLFSAVKAAAPTTGRTVFFGFGFEAINTQANRDSVMARVIRWLDGITAVDPGQEALPREFALEQNFPNPFNPETTIPYILPERSQISLRIFDILGREVAVLASGLQDAGSYVARWNAQDMSSGVYFYRLDAVSGTTEHHATRKLMLMK
jgi:hypothetical protein